VGWKSVCFQTSDARGSAPAATAAASGVPNHTPPALALRKEERADTTSSVASEAAPVASTAVT